MVGVGVGVGVVAGAGVVAAGGVTWATVAVTTAACFGSLLSAAYAAAAAPRSSTAVAPSAIAHGRQAWEPTLPGAPAPHCRHQSWPGASGAPHFVHALVARGASACADGSGAGPEPLGSASCGLPILRGRRVGQRRCHRSTILAPAPARGRR